MYVSFNMFQDAVMKDCVVHIIDTNQFLDLSCSRLSDCKARWRCVCLPESYVMNNLMYWECISHACN